MSLTRGASSGLVDALAGNFHPVLLTRADYPGGVLYLHTGVGDLSWDGHTWTGLGKFCSWELPGEESGLGTPTGSVRIAGTLEDVIGEMGKTIRNRLVQVWFGTTTTAGGNVIAGDPVSIFSGYFDSRRFDLSKAGEDAFSHDLILGLGIGPAARSKASITHGPEDQAAKFPGDTAGRQVINAIKSRANPPVWPEP